MTVVDDSARRAVEAHPLWYHTIELAPGLVTPGYFDTRATLAHMPFPDVKGKRCLDVGTYDGFFAFEMERRGAAEVIAVDIEDHMLWDWPPAFRPTREAMEQLSGKKGDGFRIAAEIIGSSVQWRPISIYDLDPAELGTFDVVVLGSLLLHLRDPLRALAAVRSVCGGVFLSVEQIELWLTIFGRGRPLARLNGADELCQWWNPNAAGHKQMLIASGFKVEAEGRPFVEVFNNAPRPKRSLRQIAYNAAQRAVAGTAKPGVLHRAILTRPIP